MNTKSIDKNSFINTASDFFNEMFEPAFNSGCGNIEIRTFPKDQAPQQHFLGSESEAAKRAYSLCKQGFDVYFGVNPRSGNGGKKENVHYVSAFHAEIDYGEAGHKKTSVHQTYDEALKAIQAFPMEPTVIIHSGGGLHCYWVLSNPVKVMDIGILALENINKNLLLKLGGDPGTHNIDRVLRVPGTCNFKIPGNPRPVALISNTHRKYAYEDFQKFSAADIMESENKMPETKSADPINIDSLPVSGKIKSLIRHGNDGSYPSRSEADMAVILSLVGKGIGDNEIQKIFQTHPIGEKYRTHASPQSYLQHSLQKAKEMSDLTEEERQDPLFISRSITKTNKGYRLNVIHFESFMR